MNTINNKKTFIILSGPTAVGKTEATERFSKKLPIEVVNADVGQFYTALSIGTAKPDLSTQSSVLHHGFDLFTEPLDFSALAYRSYVEKTINEIWSRGNIPLITGGSLFYLWSLFFVPGGVIDEREARERDEGGQSLDFDREAAWQLLLEKDPIRARDLEKTKDPYRLRRALDLLSEGKLPSARAPLYTPIEGSPHFVFLTRERSELYERINQRVFEMMAQGWIREVEGLSGAWRAFLEKKKLLGYGEILRYLACDEESRDYDLLLECIQQKTRQYAKRQLTFWRKFSRSLEQEMGPLAKTSICEANLTLSTLDLYIEQVMGNLNR